MNPEKFEQENAVENLQQNSETGKKENIEIGANGTPRAEIEAIANDILRLQEAKNDLQRIQKWEAEKLEEEQDEVYEKISHRTREMLEKASGNEALLVDIRSKLLKQIFPIVIDSGLSLELMRIVLSDDDGKIPNKFVLLNEEKIPAVIKLINFDIDGTITKGDAITDQAREAIVWLLDKKVYLNFITGRDAKWALSALSFLSGYESVKEYVRIWPECGLFNIDIEGTDLQQHEVLSRSQMDEKELREKVASLFYNIKDLQRYTIGDPVPEGYFVGGDAERNLYLMPNFPKVPIPWFIWADGKQKMMAAEMIRDGNFAASEKSINNQKLAVMLLESYFKEWGYSDKIAISPTGTSIDLLPKIGGKAFDKSNSSGAAIRRVAIKEQATPQQICAQAVAFGDSSADLKFAKPFLDDSGSERGDVAVFFVGRYNQFTPGKEFSNIVAISPGVVNDKGEIGADVTAKMLKSLKGHFGV